MADQAWFPLSASQHARWFLYQLSPGGRGNHNNVFAVGFRGAVDASALSNALDLLAERHPMLRAQFRCIAARAAEQRILERIHVPLSVCDVGNMDDAALRARVSADALAPFDLAQSPLIRAHLYRRCADESVFLLVVDHLVSDGWSYWLILEELAQVLSGRSEEWAPQRTTFREYVDWQHAWLQGPQAEKQYQYWKSVLGHETPLLDLPVDSPRPAVSSGGQGVVTLELPLDVNERLLDLASRNGATLYTTLLAAFQVLLHRYCGQSEITVGTAMPGRSDARWNDVVGDFVNMVALRTDFNGDPTVAETLRSVRNTAMRGMANQDYPFAGLVDRLYRSHTPGEHPFFQAVFVFQKARRSRGLLALWNVDNQAGAVARWGALELRPFPMHHRVASDRIPLALQAIEHENGLRCDFNYDTDMLGAATVERIAGSFRLLLDAMLEDASQHVSRLPMLSDAERSRVLDTFNDTCVDYPRDILIHHAFESQVRQRPQALALRCGPDTLSYAELNGRANSIAHRLVALGVRPDDRVAICMNRTIAMVAGVLGILKAGGAYVPLDPGYPADRLAYMLADSAPVALLTQSSLRVLPDSVAVPVLHLDAENPLVDRDLDRNPVPQGLNPHSLAYVIYTSGSTGQPKGVAIEHANAANFIAWATMNFSREQLESTLLSTSLNFDLAVFEMFAPLAVGGTIAVVKDVLATDPGSAVTLINTVPSGIQALLQADGVPKQVRTINLAGEPLKRALAERIFEATAVDSIANLYGPTETTTYSTWVRMPRGQAFARHIGRPIANTRVYILDRHLEPVPVGVVGELYIAGEGVARGYLNRDELTRERFLPDPFRTPGQRMYKTGDLGRWLADGNIEYLGRNDFQIKIRGFRVELGEIEDRLLACDGVAEAVVVARANTMGDQRLIAYVVPAAGATVAVSHLRDSLARSLADFMIPSAFVTLAALPLTANGKLDRKALPAPDETAVLARSYAAPVNDAEREIASIWQSLLGLKRVGRDDHFFELGGNSLIALQLVSRLRQTFAMEISLQEVFARPVLSALAGLISNESAAPLAPILCVDRSVSIPSSWGQQRLWFVCQLDPAAGAAYHMPAGLYIRGALNRRALQATLDRIVARHEALRTRFVGGREAPAQVIDSPDVGFHLVDHDLRALDPAARSVAAEEWRAFEAAAPFDLSAGPLIRGRVLQLADDECVLLITQHHIISDGWSIGVLLREIAALYPAFVDGLEDPLAPLPIQYADYAVWQRSSLQGEALQRQIEFWRTHLAGAPALLELPTDRPRPPVQSYAGACMEVVIPSGLTRELRALSQRHEATLFMALLAGWSAFLARLSRQSDVIVGTPVANRLRPEVEPLIGLFVNTLAIRTHARSDLSVKALLAQTRATVLDAFDHQELPFEQVVDAVQPARSLSHGPLCQTLLVLDNTPQGGALALPGLVLTALPSAQSTTRYDLSLSLRESGDALAGELEYSTDLFDAGTVARYFEHFLTLLAGMVADEARTIGELPLMTAAQRRQVISEFNRTQAPVPDEKLIHRLFEQQVARQPDALALIAEDAAVSYEALNRRANRIAHRLIALGVKPDDRVAISIERSVALVAGLLGILKAGAAYVPLDPTYPPERLTYMLADSRPAALLTRAALLVIDTADMNTLPVILVDDDAPGTLPESDPTPEDLGLRPGHLAQVIYTSGSTGQPKGVMVEHANVAQLIHIHVAQCGLAPGDRMLQFASFSFDSSVVEIFPTLAAGATVVLRPAHLLAPDDSFVEFLRVQRITVVDLPTAFFHQWAHEVSEGRSRPHDSLRLVVVGGEALERRHLAAWLSSNPARGCAVLNTYGPTESTVYATAVRFDDVTALSSRDVSIGRPVPNTRVYLLDDLGQPVPIGVTGEICIAGAQVARGYFMRPELTAERFSEDPFCAASAAKLYRTGDRGRWLMDGSIEYLGRNDSQLKIRGFRIEPGEIEAQLVACCGVKEAVVVAREDATGEKRLVAYLVPVAGVDLSALELREALGRRLAESMIPSAFVTLPSLPLTPNGKVDRKALPAADLSALSVRQYVAPVGEYERGMAEIWQDLLGLERIGRDDHFFEIGGNSLGITKLGFAVKDRFGVTANVSELYGRHSLREMAAFVEERCARSAAAAETTVALEF